MARSSASRPASIIGSTRSRPAPTPSSIFTWGGGYGGQGEEHLADINAWADQLVASMHFQ